MGLSPLPTIDSLSKLRARPLVGPARARAKPWSLGLSPLDAFLPDAGLPRGAVVELCSTEGLGHVTRVALAACAAAQHEAYQQEEHDRAWCAWVDSSASLFAPGAVRVGVDLDRLLVVRPPLETIGRLAVRLTASGVFSVVVVDRTGVPGAKLGAEQRTRWSTVVRRLALAAEGSDGTVVLLSSLRQARAQPLPVALRLELARPSADRLSMRISKERQGRVRGPYSVSLLPLADAS